MIYLLSQSIEILTDELSRSPEHLRDFYRHRIAQLRAWLFNETHNLPYNADAALEAMIEWGTVE